MKICKAFWGAASSKMEVPQSKCLRAGNTADPGIL